MTMSESRSVIKITIVKHRFIQLKEGSLCQKERVGSWKDEQRFKNRGVKSILDQEKNKNKYIRTTEYMEDTFKPILLSQHTSGQENQVTLYKL